MAPTTSRKFHNLRNFALFLLCSRVLAFGHLQARDDLAWGPGGDHGWPGDEHGYGHGHGHGNGHDGDGDNEGGTGCSCPNSITTSPIASLETDVPVQTVTTTVTVPGPTVTSPGNTTTVQGSTITAPGITVTILGSIDPIYQPTPETVTITVPAGPSITVTATNGILDNGLNGGNLGPSITAPPIPKVCRPQTVIETVLTTVTSTIARPRYRQ